MAVARSPRVLVVDDDPRFSLAVTVLLESVGIVVVGRAENGQAGLALAAKFDPDVVTMDIDMPVMDGVDAALRFRARFPEVSVIMLSGSTSTDRVEEALHSGAVWAVEKTRTTEDLVRVIRHVARLPSTARC